MATDLRDKLKRRHSPLLDESEPSVKSAEPTEKHLTELRQWRFARSLVDVFLKGDGRMYHTADKNLSEAQNMLDRWLLSFQLDYAGSMDSRYPLFPQSLSEEDSVNQKLIDECVEKKFSSDRENARTIFGQLEQRLRKFLKDDGRDEDTSDLRIELIEDSEDAAHVTLGDFKSKHCWRVKFLVRNFGLLPATRMLIRYEALGTGSLQWGDPITVHNALHDLMGVRYEGFASPLNSKMIDKADSRFCSLFIDTDEEFGSMGSFFKVDFSKCHGGWTVNPPFIEELMDRVATKVLNYLDTGDENCWFFVTFPRWDDTPGWVRLSDSKRRIDQIELDDGGFTVQDCYGRIFVPRNNLTIFVMGNRLPDDANLKEIRKMFRNLNRHMVEEEWRMTCSKQLRVILKPSRHRAAKTDGHETGNTADLRNRLKRRHSPLLDESEPSVKSAEPTEKHLTELRQWRFARSLVDVFLKGDGRMYHTADKNLSEAQNMLDRWLLSFQLDYAGSMDSRYPLFPQSLSEEDSVNQKLIDECVEKKFSSDRENARTIFGQLEQRLRKFLKDDGRDEDTSDLRIELIEDSEDAAHVTLGDFKSKHCWRVKFLVRNFGLLPATRMLIRYEALGTGSLQWGDPITVHNALHDLMGVRYEGFASPLNSKMIDKADSRFCSLFIDTDEEFGSMGSFFKVDFSKCHGGWTVNPPFIEELMDRVATKVLNYLDTGDENCWFFVTFPRWDDTPGWVRLSDSKRRIDQIELDDGGFTVQDCYGRIFVPRNNLTIFVMGNRLPDDANLKEIRKMFRNLNRHMVEEEWRMTCSKQLRVILKPSRHRAAKTDGHETGNTADLRNRLKRRHSPLLDESEPSVKSAEPTEKHLTELRQWRFARSLVDVFLKGDGRMYHTADKNLSEAQNMLDRWLLSFQLDYAGSMDSRYPLFPQSLREEDSVNQKLIDECVEKKFSSDRENARTIFGQLEQRLRKFLKDDGRDEDTSDLRIELIEDSEDAAHVTLGDFKSKHCWRVKFLVRNFGLLPATRMLIRYEALGTGSLQWGDPITVHNALHDLMGVRYEGFASPLNSKMIDKADSRFCSLFIDTDEEFGSMGSFFKVDFSKCHGGWHVNPPFIEAMMDRVASRILDYLDTGDENCWFFVTFPRWDDAPSWERLSLSKHLIDKFALDNGGFTVQDGYGRVFEPRNNLTIFVLGHRLPEGANLQEIRKMFRNLDKSRVEQEWQMTCGKQVRRMLTATRRSAVRVSGDSPARCLPDDDVPSAAPAVLPAKPVIDPQLKPNRQLKRFKKS
ncbi:hypothetical protein BOX15_Mlig000263g6 [Macrostomum lignano]|uniref:PCIF1 WW domain-containing protein n=1 Tax=Macrostomum lignano TaxID=282301 RepID=A0A267E5H1_9PLAT|nr:hypothetical protein BOX15_Mlig000263g6 [Macrostomum lignano]